MMTEVPIFIAGGGPVGMTLALDLAARGIRSLVAERNITTTSHPKMDITNSRSMELFRRLGIVDELRAAAVPEDNPFDVSWVTTMSGMELHRFRYPSVNESRKNIWEYNDGSQALEPPMRVSQVEIEPVLRRCIERSSFASLRFGLEVLSFEQDASGVTVVARGADGGDETFRCKFLVGCDGGRSVVRSLLDISLQGDSHIMQRFMTHFRSDARNLLQRWGPAWHYQSQLGTLIAQNDKDVWTLHSRLDERKDVSVDPSKLISEFVGAQIPHQVIVANRWSPHLLVADRFQSGRVLLAGDAVHQYIPTGGYGMNTGIGDACDLGWKLAATLQGFGGPNLLKSYECERRPVALRNRDASKQHNDIRVRIGNAFRAEVYDGKPSNDEAREALSATIANLGNLENESRGIELGYVYNESPIIERGQDEGVSLDIAHYHPTTVPGARLPSIFLQDGTALFDQLGPWFTVLLFNGGHPGSLLATAKQKGIPVRLLRLIDEPLRHLYGWGLIIVRPDQHVGWRGENVEDDQVANNVWNTLLGWQSFS